jgi:hypothetical protein
VFSSQVLEHLHPDDVPDHLSEVIRVLKPNGWLGFDTPNRVTGPHDISRGFTPEATGLHLKEWSYAELDALLRDTGFTEVVGRWLPGRLASRLGYRPPGPMVSSRWKCRLERWVSAIPDRALRGSVGRILGVDSVYLYARSGS